MFQLSTSSVRKKRKREEKVRTAVARKNGNPDIRNWCNSYKTVEKSQPIEKTVMGWDNLSPPDVAGLDEVTPRRETLAVIWSFAHVP